MANPIIRIHDIETNEVIDRPMTDEEFADYQEAQEEQARIEAEKLAAKNAILTKLGVTAEELAKALS